MINLKQIKEGMLCNVFGGRFSGHDWWPFFIFKNPIKQPGLLTLGRTFLDTDDMIMFLETPKVIKPSNKFAVYQASCFIMNFHHINNRLNHLGTVKFSEMNLEDFTKLY